MHLSDDAKFLFFQFLICILLPCNHDFQKRPLDVSEGLSSYYFDFSYIHYYYEYAYVCSQ